MDLIQEKMKNNTWILKVLKEVLLKTLCDQFTYDQSRSQYKFKLRDHLQIKSQLKLNSFSQKLLFTIL